MVSVEIYSELKTDMPSVHANIVHENRAIGDAAVIAIQAIAQRSIALLLPGIILFLLIHNTASPAIWLGPGLSEFLAQSTSIMVISGRSSYSQRDVHGQISFVRTLTSLNHVSPGSSGTPISRALSDLTSKECELRYRGIRFLSLLVCYSM
jgi:hypothetical protein